MAVLKPRPRKLLRTLHIAITVSVLGADLVLLTLALAGFAMDPAAIYPAAEVIGTRVVAPLAIGALGTGVLLALLTPYGLLRYWWVAIKLAVTAALSAVVLFVLVPALGASADAAIAAEGFSDARRLPLVLAPAAAIALLLLNIGLAVFKPGWRIGSLRRRALPDAVPTTDGRPAP